MTSPSRKLWHTAEASMTVFTIQKLFIIESLNSDLQAGIWFGSVALSPVITLPHFTIFLSSLPKNVIFSAHVHMCTDAYISSIT